MVKWNIFRTFVTLSSLLTAYVINIQDEHISIKIVLWFAAFMGWLFLISPSEFELWNEGN